MPELTFACPFHQAGTVPPCGLLPVGLLASVSFSWKHTHTTGGLSPRRVSVQSRLTVALNHLRWLFLGTVLRYWFAVFTMSLAVEEQFLRGC